jgi:hypothetical protein
MSIALVVVVPGLLALPATTLGAKRTLGAFARYADAPHREPRGIAAALFGVLDVSPATPVGPLAMIGAGGEPGDDYVLCADPVHLAVDRDTVVLAQTIDDLSPNDAIALVSMLNRHFADDDLHLEVLRPNAWFARREQPADIETTPPDAARGRKLIASVPRGREAGTWKRWQNEIEMLLHEHPVNVAREADSRAPANAVWFSGGGRSADVGTLPPATVTAADTRLGDLAHGIARRADPAAPRMNDTLAEAITRAARQPGHADVSTFVLGVVPPLAGDLEDLEHGWVAPALAALEAHRVDTLHLVADGDGSAVTWTAPAPTRWQRLVARASRRAFEIPAPPDA